MAHETRLNPVVDVIQPRTASRNRSTKETTIEIHVNLDEKPTTPINSGVELMNVIMTELRTHAGINFTIDCLGDTYIDDHHTVEDVAIALKRMGAEAVAPSQTHDGNMVPRPCPQHHIGI
uniref:imidazoleglycerol-phosphate dehydratase n=1 Tax=Proboscia inermis TaxID=420281 RepID=A0A7S0C7L4_9STRA|mmetsp:Transcript_32312/g.32615  ORF Transcript_32312/g.32615 Transcript_32312/m.32615 type:complete len:120 (+) Transcript_32312:189-548(+)